MHRLIASRWPTIGHSTASPQEEIRRADLASVLLPLLFDWCRPLESPTRDQSELPLRFSVAGSARTNASLGELAEEGRGLAPRYSRHLARQMNCCTDPGRLLRRVSGLRGDRLPWYHRQQYVRRVALVMENGLRRCLPAAARGLVLTSVQVAVEAWEIAGRNLQAHAMPR